MAGFKETKFNDRMDTAAKARAEMLAKAKIRAEAAKVNFESKTEERKAIVVARALVSVGNSRPVFSAR